MAEPIRKVKRMQISEEKVIDHNVDEVRKAVSANKDAILDGINMLASLHNSDFLMAGSAMVNHRKEIVKNFSQEINKPQYEGALHNLGQMFFLLGDLNIDQMEDFTKRINNGLDSMVNTREEERTSYVGLLRALKDPEVNHSLTMLLNFLKGMSRKN
ncbi:DUF1641 domain-containing protein [Aciduricibacillus chroicocephali]|uniref:DUF1641 domain-containing protein n=1 Tax=Aciduricibacillus chroicocephali TaxID=3054939 RepID=A0ABY9KY06_9BACI|nr:DUF1641 domain-containing protein [Bacillaceae bacterium 44XB]